MQIFGPSDVITPPNWLNDPWAVGANYLLHDALLHNGTSYRATGAHTAAADTEPGVGANWSTVWRVIAARGTDGVDGVDGADGADGAPGAPGQGVPAGGAINEVLKKASAADYDTVWGDASTVANLDDLLDVNAPTPADNQALTWDAATSKWVPETIAGGGGGGGSTLPTAKASRALTAQSVPHSTTAVMSFDTEVWDTAGMWAVGTPSRITITEAGRYLITGSMVWAASSNGIRQIGIRKNGSTYLSAPVVSGGVDTAGQTTVAVADSAIVGDYYELFIWQNSGSALNLLADARNHMAVMRIPDTTGGGGGGGTNNYYGAGKATLACKVHEPTTRADYTTSSTTLTDVDATNAVVTFVAPSSGKVLLRVAARVIPNASAAYFWGLKEGSTVLEEAPVSNASGVDFRRTLEFYITGLTPGATYTYKLAHRTGVSGQNHAMYAGGSGGTESGPLVLEVSDPEPTDNPGPASRFVGVRAYKTVAQSLGSGTNTPIDWDTESFDSDGFHETTTNPSRLVVPAGKSGKYLLATNVAFAANSTGVRQVFFRVNGTIIQGANSMVEPVSSGNSTVVSASGIFDLAAGDYVEVVAKQTSGGALNVEGGNVYSTTAALTYLGPTHAVDGTFTGVRAHSAADQSIPNNTETPVALTVESFDVGGFHDNATNNTRFTVPAGKAGKYRLKGSIRYGAANNGYRSARIRKNGTTRLVFTNVPTLGAGSVTTVAVDTTVDLVVGDYVELIAMHDQGAALNVNFDDSATFFEAAYLGPNSAATPPPVGVLYPPFSFPTGGGAAPFPTEGLVVNPVRDILLTDVFATVLSSGPTMRLRVYELNGTTQVGGPLFTSSSWVADGKWRNLDVGLTLVGGKRYVIAVQNQASAGWNYNYGGATSHFLLGSVFIARINSVDPATGSTWTLEPSYIPAEIIPGLSA